MTQISATRTCLHLKTLVSQALHTGNEMFRHFGIVFSVHVLENTILQHFGIVFNAHMLENKVLQHFRIVFNAHRLKKQDVRAFK